jgi:Flp pilus assembly protein CpaB
MGTSRIRNLALPSVLAALAVALTLVYLAQAGTRKSPPQTGVGVYVATRDIAAGTAGSAVAGALKLVHVPASAVVPGAVLNPAGLAGRIAADPIYRGEQLSFHRFVDLQQQGVLARLSGRMRAMQIAGDANQLLFGTLRTGDRVDVVASLKTPEKQVPYGRTVLRDVLVVSAPSARSSSQSGGTNVYTAMLQLTDAQAQTLFFVTRNGDWSLVLRPMVRGADGADFVDSMRSVLQEGR